VLVLAVEAVVVVIAACVGGTAIADVKTVIIRVMVITTFW